LFCFAILSLLALLAPPLTPVQGRPHFEQNCPLKSQLGHVPAGCFQHLVERLVIPIAVARRISVKTGIFQEVPESVMLRLEATIPYKIRAGNTLKTSPWDSHMRNRITAHQSLESVEKTMFLDMGRAGEGGRGWVWILGSGLCFASL